MLPHNNDRPVIIFTSATSLSSSFSPNILFPLWQARPKVYKETLLNKVYQKFMDLYRKGTSDMTGYMTEWP